jgi:PAS domain S-box-containing protein
MARNAEGDPEGLVAAPDHAHQREWQAAANARSVGELRRAVKAFAQDQGVEAAALASMTLAVSEAITNAVLHAFIDREPGQVTVVAEALQDEFRVRVIDDGRGMQPRSDSPGLGLGLPTIGQMTSRLDIREAPTGTGTEVAMSFASPGLAGPADPFRSRDAARFRILDQVAELGGASAWPAPGLHRLAALLVPAVADVCVVNLVEDDEVTRRLATKVAGPRAEELTAWLTARPPSASAPPPMALLSEHPGGRTREIDPAALDEAASDDRDRELLDALPARWWTTVPMVDDGRLLGVLGLGFDEARGAPSDSDQNFFVAVAERAARALANTWLIDELQRTRRRLDRILGVLAEAVTVSDAAGQVVYANEAASRLLGAESIEEVLAARPGELAGRFIITREDGAPVRLDDLPGQRILAGNATVDPMLTRSVERATGRAFWLLTKASRLDDDGIFAVNVIEDVTEEKNAEIRLRFLARTTELLLAPADMHGTLERIAEMFVPDLADWCAIDMVQPDGSVARLALTHVDPRKRELGREIHARYPPDMGAEVGLAAIVRGGPSEVYPQLTDEMLEQGAVDDEHLHLLREIGMRAVMLVPMRVGERTLGVLTLVTDESGRVFTDEDLVFAEDIARRAARAVEQAQTGSS